MKNGFYKRKTTGRLQSKKMREKWAKESGESKREMLQRKHSLRARTLVGSCLLRSSLAKL